MNGKLMAFLLAVLLIVSLGCTQDDGKESRNKKNLPKVVCTTTMIADLAENVAAGRFEIVPLMKPGQDPHTYKVKPWDSGKIREAKIVLRNGLELEGTLEGVIKNSLSEDTLNVALAESDKIEVAKSLQYKGAPDPHVWMNVAYFQIMVENCVQAFSKADPEGKKAFEKAGMEYMEKLEKLHEYAKKKIGEIPRERRILITTHDAFQYFGKAYDIQVEALAGISTQQSPEPQDVENLIAQIKNTKIKAVFIETSVNKNLIDMMRRVRDRTGARNGGALYSDSLGEKDSEAPTYIKMIRFNVDTIVENLK